MELPPGAEVFRQNLEMTIAMSCQLEACNLVRVDMEAAKEPDVLEPGTIRYVCEGSCGLGRESLKAALRLAGEMAIAAGELGSQYIDDTLDDDPE